MVHAMAPSSALCSSVRLPCSHSSRVRYASATTRALRRKRIVPTQRLCGRPTRRRSVCRRRNGTRCSGCSGRTPRCVCVWTTPRRQRARRHSRQCRTQALRPCRCRWTRGRQMQRLPPIELPHRAMWVKALRMSSRCALKRAVADPELQCRPRRHRRSHLRHHRRSHRHRRRNHRHRRCLLTSRLGLSMHARCRRRRCPLGL